jgi:hypothetical protein
MFLIRLVEWSRMKATKGKQYEKILKDILASPLSVLILAKPTIPIIKVVITQIKKKADTAP